MPGLYGYTSNVAVTNTTGLYQLNANVSGFYANANNVSVTQTTGLYQLNSNSSVFNSAQTLNNILSNSASIGFYLTNSNQNVAGTVLSSGVTSGAYGNAAYYPTFTVGSDGRLTVAGTVSVVAAAGTYSNTNVAAYLTTATISTTGNITAGNLISNNFLYPNGASILTGIGGTYSNANVASYLPVFGGNVNASSIFHNTTGVAIQSNSWAQLQYTNTRSAPADQTNIGTGSWFYVDASGGAFESNTTGTIRSIFLGNDGSILAQGNITGANLTTGGNVTATYVKGNAALMTGLTAASAGVYGSATVIPTIVVDATGRITQITTNTATGGSYGNSNVASYLPTYTGSMPNLTSINTTGNITANAGGYFIGDGSKLTNLPAGNYSNVNVGAYLASNTVTTITTTGNITTVANIVSPNYLYPNGVSILTGIGGTYSNTNVAAYLTTATIATTGNITAANLITAGNVYGSYIIGDGSLLTNLPVQAGTYSNTNVTALLSSNTVSTIFTTGNITTVANVNAGTIHTTDGIYAQGNVTAPYFVGDGSALTNIVTRLVAGANIALSPSGGTGAVTISTIGGTAPLTSTGYYGSFYDTTTQYAPSATTAYTVGVNSTIATNGVTLAGNVMTFANAGVYQVAFSIQLVNTDNAQHEANVWLTQNGSVLSNSNSQVTIAARGNPATPGTTLMTVPLVITVAAGDTIGLQWQTNAGSTQVSIASVAAGTSPTRPAIPGVILYATQVTSVTGNQYGNSNVATFLSAGFGSNTITTTGNITAGNLIATSYVQGDGSKLTNLPVQAGTYSNTNVTAYLAGTVSVGNISSTSGYFWANGTAYSTASGGGSSFSGNLLGNTLTDSVNGRILANASPQQAITQIGTYTQGVAVTATPSYTGANLNSANQTVSFVSSGNVNFLTSFAAGTRTTIGTFGYLGVTATSANSAMNSLDRIRPMVGGMDLNLNGKNWGALSSASNLTVPVLVNGQTLNIYGTGQMGQAGGIGAVTTITPVGGSISAQYITSNFPSINYSTAGAGYTASNINTARLYTGGITAVANLTVINAIGLHVYSGWVSANTSLVTNAYAVLNEDTRSSITSFGPMNQYAAFTSNAAMTSTGGLQATAIGNVTPGTAAFTTLSANSTVTLTSANVSLGAYQEKTYNFGNTGGNITVDYNNGSVQSMTLTSNMTLNTNSITNMIDGRSLKLIITQDGTGGRTLTSNLLYPSANCTLSTGSGAIDTIDIYYTGTNYLANVIRTYTAPASPTYNVNWLIVGGGGAGGSSPGPGAGGGAGGVVSGSTTVTIGTPYSVTVGAGGAATTSARGNNGSDSTAFGYSGLGGGGGGSAYTGSGAAGGSGGGAYGYPNGTYSGGAGTSGQGNAGGAGYSDNVTYTLSGGGGGAGAVGASGNLIAAGAGGIGVQSSITGSAVYYGGGGGSAGQNGFAAGASGGLGGGGQGGISGGSDTQTSGTANTGGGGGGAGNESASGAGGSGVVILSVPTAKYSGTVTGTYTVTTSGANTIIKFTSGTGSYTA